MIGRLLMLVTLVQEVISPKLTSKEDNSDNIESKLGRNDKVELISPSGEKIKVKFKKIDQYLMKGYTRV